MRLGSFYNPFIYIRWREIVVLIVQRLFRCEFHFERIDFVIIIFSTMCSQNVEKKFKFTCKFILWRECRAKNEFGGK